MRVCVCVRMLMTHSHIDLYIKVWRVDQIKSNNYFFYLNTTSKQCSLKSFFVDRESHFDDVIFYREKIQKRPAFSTLNLSYNFIELKQFVACIWIG